MSWKYAVAALVLVLVGALIGRWTLPGDTPVSAPIEVVAPLSCADHGVPEDVCTRCHPELIPSFQASGDWCAGHGVPETQCALCHPDVAAAGVKPPGAEDDPHAGHDDAPGEEPEERVLTNDPFPGLSVIYNVNQPACPTDEAVIQFATAETAERAGIEWRGVMVAALAESFEAPAEVVFDQNATTVLSSTLPVSLIRWEREPGDRIRAGDVLATVESPEMAMLQGDYLQAWSDWQVQDRERRRAGDLVARGLIDSASYERAAGDAISARAHRVQAESRLKLAGLADADLQSLREGENVGARFPLRATTDGVLLERSAPLGRVLDAGTALARLGEPDALWIEAHVRERDAARLSVGQHVEFTGDGSALRRTHGTVIWIADFLDPHSRTVTVRVRPGHGDAPLRAHEFGRLHIPDGASEPSILVPRNAVQWEGCCNVVFVREAPDRFKPRKVRVVPGDAEHYRVLDGLAREDAVVVRGSFLLKTELMKGAIGAGCCGLEAST